MQQAIEHGDLAELTALDARGQQAESLEWLKTASKLGNLPAMSELAHRLLTGDRAPKSPKHALYLLAEAAKRGEGRALARLAALTAGGAYLPQDWPRALQLLREAAQAGNTDAEGQLRCLRPHSGYGDAWQADELQQTLAFWSGAATTEALHPSVSRVIALAPPAVCNWLIQRGRGRLGPALVYDAVSRENQRHEMRTNSMALFDYATLDVVQFLVQERMSRTCRYPLQHFEAPTVLHYATGQQITPHFDFIDARAADYENQIREYGQRMITFLLYLSEDYEGGETTFPELGLVHRGSTGCGLFFINAHADLQPDRRMLHAGSPPRRGEKWIVTQFVVSKRLRP
jgi:prolyl 4-hydroxylase